MKHGKPTTPEAQESTQKLLWFDNMANAYVRLGNAALVIMDEMELQPRKDESAYAKLADIRQLAQDKYELLSNARAAHFERHTQLMTALMESED